jgi:hypothetical protein
MRYDISIWRNAVLKLKIVPAPLIVVIVVLLTFTASAKPTLSDYARDVQQGEFETANDPEAMSRRSFVAENEMVRATERGELHEVKKEMSAVEASDESYMDELRSAAERAEYGDAIESDSGD